MFERLKMLYEQGRIDKAGLLKAVERKWITPAQYKEIVGEDK